MTKLKYFLGLVIILFLCFFTILYIAKRDEVNKVSYIPDYINYYKYGITTDEFINTCDTIAKYEGLSYIPYTYNNYSYIGYGHQIKNIELFNVRKIDSIIAREILYSDLDIALNEAFRITHLTGNKVLAISDFIFNYGTSAFINSTLYSTIIANPYDTLKIKKELFKWNKIDSKINPQLTQRRKFDYSLYRK